MPSDALIEAMVQNKQIRKIEYTYEFISNLTYLFQLLSDKKVKMDTHIPEDLTVLRAVAGEDSVVLYAVSKEFGALPPGSAVPYFNIEFKDLKSVILTK
jgi:hypothetical protein